VWIRQWRRGNNCTAVAAVASLCFLALVAPWIWRCSKTYGRFVAFRGNFGLEVLVGNSSDTSHPANSNMLPGYNIEELNELERVGESAYMVEKQKQARELVLREPLRYVVLTIRRVINTWTAIWDFPPALTLENSGLLNVLMYSLISALAFMGIGTAIRDRQDYVFPLAVLPVVFPMLYYLTHSDLGFRHPIDPVLTIFAVYGIWSGAQNRKK
jgi:hypothetical protein